MTKNEAIVVLQFMKASLEADKFHLSVAKAILSSWPPSEHIRAQLLDALATRETQHESQEALLAEMKRILNV